MAPSLFNLAVLACVSGASARRFKIRQFTNATTSSIEEPCTSSVHTPSTPGFSTFSWTNTSSTVPVTSSDAESATSDVLPIITLTPSGTVIVTGSVTSTDSLSATGSSSADSTDLAESTANPGSTGSAGTNVSGTVSATSAASGVESTHASGTAAESGVTSASQPSVTSSASVTELTTSTVFTTTVHTITKCPPSVPNCPVGSVVTETIPLYTTVCPVTGTSKGSSPPKPTNPPSHDSETLTTTFHTTYTITKCPPSVPNCPVGSVTTDVVTTTYCPGKGEPVPTAPGGEHPTAPGSEHPTGPVVEHPTGPTAEYPEVPTVTLKEQPKPSAPVVEQPPAKESETGHYTVPTGHHSTISVPAHPSGFNSTTIPSKPSSTSTTPSTTAPVSSGVKTGVSVMALLGAMLVMM